jgi:hypothetical protein
METRMNSNLPQDVASPSTAPVSIGAAGPAADSGDRVLPQTESDGTVADGQRASGEDHRDATGPNAGGNATATSNQASKPSSPEPADQQAPAQPIPQDVPTPQDVVTRRRSTIHNPTREQMLDTVRRLIIKVAEGEVSREDSKELRALCETYLRHLGPDTKSPKSRSDVDLPALRAMAHERPRLLDILESVLSDEEIDELVNGSRGSAPQ